MKGTDKVFATCMFAGAIVAFLVWFIWDLPWQGLGMGFFVGLILGQFVDGVSAGWVRLDG